MTKQNGVNAWPNAAVWMRDELRSKVKAPVDKIFLQMTYYIHLPYIVRRQSFIDKCNLTDALGTKITGVR